MRSSSDSSAAGGARGGPVLVREKRVGGRRGEKYGTVCTCTTWEKINISEKRDGKNSWFDWKEQTVQF